MYNNIRPVASQHPRMYRLPNIPKVDDPPNPILSLVGSLQHGMVQWFINVLISVLVFYSKYSVPNSFQFVAYIVFYSKYSVRNSFQFVAYMRKLQPNIDNEYFILLIYLVCLQMSHLMMALIFV